MPRSARSARAALARAVARASSVRHVTRPVAPGSGTAFDLAYLRADPPSPGAQRTGRARS